MQKQQFPGFLNISNIFNLGIQDSEHAITKKNCKPKKQKGKKIKQCQKQKGRRRGGGRFTQLEKAQRLHSAEAQRELLGLRGEIRWVPPLMGLWKMGTWLNV